MNTQQNRPPSWNPVWEESVYGQGRQLNRYPHHAVVGFMLSAFRDVGDRGKVRVLEMGCGAGNNLWFAAREGFSVAGLDGSASAVEYARKRFDADGLVGDLRAGDFGELPWADGEMDVVIDRASITHCPRDVVEAALSEARRVLKPGGRLFSMIYSSLHPGRECGRALPDGTYADFTGGYFEGLGTVYFCTDSDIRHLYGSRFTLNSVTLIQEAACDLEYEPEATNAIWKVIATR